jgi:predicted secreted protein
LEQGKIQIQDQVELSEIQDQFQLEQAGFQIQDHLEPVEIQDQFTELVFNEYKEQIKSLQQKLESATYRIGYLQHHVESQDLQIKLLTDSQHKPGRWQRFRSWFFGQ